MLASCSDYFRAMFTDAMRESRQSEICLNGVTAAGIRLLLDYAYTSRLALNLANIQDVLSAASHVQVVAVVEACSNYLQVNLLYLSTFLLLQLKKATVFSESSLYFIFSLGFLHYCDDYRCESDR